MPETIKTPKFNTEQEEAEWWDSPEGRDAIRQNFQNARQAGTLERGVLKRRGVTPTTTIRLDPRDVELAKAQAEERGLRYQTYLKMVLHQALRREADQRR